jgi:hypothetical protein
MENISQGFSIIEFLLVLTAFVLFLGAAFIGYRTIKANADQEHISQRVNLFIKGIKQYANDFGAYPYITCANANDWNTAASSNKVASCSALMSYIGHWLAKQILVKCGSTMLGLPTICNLDAKALLQAAMNHLRKAFML